MLSNLIHIEIKHTVAFKVDIRTEAIFKAHLLDCFVRPNVERGAQALL